MIARERNLFYDLKKKYSAKDGEMGKLEFTERMCGCLFNEQTVGLRKNDLFEFTVNVVIENVDHFLNDANKTAQLNGFVIWNNVKAKIYAGNFNLFINPSLSSELNTVREMHYRFKFNYLNVDYALVGYKKMNSEELLNIWEQTTTLHISLYKTQLSDFQLIHEAIPNFQGQLKITAGDFIRQLGTFKVSDNENIFLSQSFLKFIKLFSGEIWKIYAPFVVSDQSERWIHSPFALGTTIGVPFAHYELHSVETKDKIYIELQRFYQKKSKKIILLVHGLTLSTDMFVMPEIVNLVSFLHQNNFDDIWSLDWRGSNRFKYNLEINDFNIDHVAHYDLPAAIEKIRSICGEDVEINIISHCVGSLAVMASIASDSIYKINKVVANSVSLNPQTRFMALIKLIFGPFIFQNIFGYPYLSPKMPYMKGVRFGKFLYWISRLFIHECKEPACHMISLMWGWGYPTPFSHQNLMPVTHSRLADLFGGISFSYYRHMRRMILKNKNISHGLWKGKDFDYFELIKSKKELKLFLTSGSDNKIFPNSNKKTFELLKGDLPNIKYSEFSGYGHQDLFMGKNAHLDYFPSLVSFLKD